MDHVIARLTAIARRLGVSTDSLIFLDALEVAVAAYEDRRGVECAIELARPILVAGSTESRSQAALTAA